MRNNLAIERGQWEQYFALIPRDTVSGILWLRKGWRRTVKQPGWYSLPHTTWEYNKQFANLTPGDSK